MSPTARAWRLRLAAGLPGPQQRPPHDHPGGPGRGRGAGRRCSSTSRSRAGRASTSRDAEFGSGRPFENDDMVTVEDLASGIVIVLDGLPRKESVDGKPVGRVLVDLQWPLRPEGEAWFEQSFGFQTVELSGEFVAKENVLVWEPQKRIVDVLVRVRDRLVSMDADHILGAPALPIRGRVQTRRLGDHRRRGREPSPQRPRRDRVGQRPDRPEAAHDRRRGRRAVRDVVLLRRRAAARHRSTASRSRTSQERPGPGSRGSPRRPGWTSRSSRRRRPASGRTRCWARSPAEGARLVPGQPLTIRVARGAGG